MAAYRLLACIMLEWWLIVLILLILCYFALLYVQRKLLWSSWRATNSLFKFSEFAAIVKKQVPSVIIISTKAGAMNGHHDLMAGVIICNIILQRWFFYVEMWARCCQNWQIVFIINAVRNGLSPIDSLLLLWCFYFAWIANKALYLLLPNIYKYLHSLGFHVNYSGLDRYPGREIHI